MVWYGMVGYGMVWYGMVEVLAVSHTLLHISGESVSVCLCLCLSVSSFLAVCLSLDAILFLVTCTRLYKPLCWSFGPLVGPLVADCSKRATDGDRPCFHLDNHYGG